MKNYCCIWHPDALIWLHGPNCSQQSQFEVNLYEFLAKNMNRRTFSTLFLPKRGNNIDKKCHISSKSCIKSIHSAPTNAWPSITPVSGNLIAFLVSNRWLFIIFTLEKPIESPPQKLENLKNFQERGSNPIFLLVSCSTPPNQVTKTVLTPKTKFFMLKYQVKTCFKTLVPFSQNSEIWASRFNNFFIS